MDKVILIIGILIILEGVVLLLKPDWIKKVIRFFAKGKALYLAALLRLILGVLFLVSARECDKPWIAIAFGILLLLAGISMFIIKLDKMKAYLGWWYERSLITIRLLSLAAFAIGAIIIYAS